MVPQVITAVCTLTITVIGTTVAVWECLHHHKHSKEAPPTIEPSREGGQTEPRASEGPVAFDVPGPSTSSDSAGPSSTDGSPSAVEMTILPSQNNSGNKA